MKHILVILFISVFVQSCCERPICITARAQTPEATTFVLYNVSNQPITLFSYNTCYGTQAECCQWALFAYIGNGRTLSLACAPGQVRTFHYNVHGTDLCGTGATTFNISGYSNQNTAIYLR